ncbi:unnamed protein product [Rangifer tarandus platyrhynchus]|uniref:Uncharacterized protein n=1 Tax=Rangifer tarandus platyrhynchus TaxID=3082113 RepID=A0AC60A879_RANTA
MEVGWAWGPPAHRRLRHHRLCCVAAQSQELQDRVAWLSADSCVCLSRNAFCTEVQEACCPHLSPAWAPGATAPHPPGDGHWPETAGGQGPPGTCPPRATFTCDCCLEAWTGSSHQPPKDLAGRQSCLAAPTLRHQPRFPWRRECWGTHCVRVECGLASPESLLGLLSPPSGSGPSLCRPRQGLCGQPPTFCTMIPIGAFAVSGHELGHQDVNG